MSRIKNIIIGIFLIYTFSINAQTGYLRGNIYDKENGETLIGATVLVTGTINGTTTDFDGNYSLPLETGKYNITISYISYNSQKFEKVVINPGEVTILNVALSTASLQISEVVVTARARQRTESALQVLQKKSPKLLDGISSEQISKLGDSNVGQALKRVTGVSVQEGKYVFVRGLSERYTKVTLNNAEIPALDPEKNTVQVDIFPSNIVENIIVNKSFTPDMPGESTGGQVNIITKDFPEKFTFQFSNSFSFNPQANLSEDFLSYEGGKTDWFGMDDGSRSIPDRAQLALNRMITNDLGQIIYTPSTNGYSYEDLNAITNSFSKEMAPQPKKSFLNHGHKISIGNQSQIFKKTFGYNIAINYDHEYEFYNDGIFGEYEDESITPNKKVNEINGDEKVMVSGLFNFNIKLNNNNKLGARFFHSHSGKKRARIREGFFNYEDAYVQDRMLAYIERSFNNIQLHGKHILPNINNTILNWQTSLTNMSQDEPDNRFFENLYDINNNDTTFRTKTNDKPARFYRYMSEYNISNKVDVEVPLKDDPKSAKIKFGGSYDYKFRDLDDIRFDMIKGNTDMESSNINYFMENFVITQNAISNGEDYYYWTSDHNANLNKSQEAYLMVTAGYVMLDIPISEKFRLVTGARLELTEIHTENKRESNDTRKIDVTNNFTDILPSLNLTYSLTEKMNLRLAYSNTVARPTFKEIGPTYYDYLTSEIVRGNPNLKRTFVSNLDSKWEYFFKSGEKISFGAFYKYFSDPIEKVIDINAVNREFEYQNSKEIQLFGAELELRKKLDFLALLSNFTFGGNFTYIKSIYKIPDEELEYIQLLGIDKSSERPMQGQAPYIINCYLNYLNKKLKLNANLALNISGEKLNLISFGRLPYAFEQPRPSLNFTLSKELSKSFTADFSIKNILDPEHSIVHHYPSGDEYYRKYKKGRSFGISIKYLIK